MRLAALIASFIWTAAAQAADSTLTVHLLDHTQKPPGEKKFWIDWSNEWRGIVQSKTVTGTDAEKLIELLHKSLKSTAARTFCGHDPIYGIVVADKEEKLWKTSLCFKCLTWVKPGERLEIAGQKGPQNELCLALRKVIELPDAVLKAQ